MEEIRFDFQEAWFYLTVINVILGFLFGSFPLIAGLKLHNRKYGVFGLASSVIGGGLLGIILSFPLAMLFTWLILLGSSTVPPDDSDVPTEHPEDWESDDSIGR